jgi:hypothetical protein
MLVQDVTDLARRGWMSAVVAFLPALAFGQTVESIGARAMGLGGAFVAVADDASATWWNPAGLAVGPFVEVATGGGVASRPTDHRALRQWGIGVSTPALGAHYYDVDVLDTIARRPTASPGAGRQEGRVGPLPPSLSFGQFGVTVLHTVFSRVHVGATLKGVRARARGLDFDASETHVDADVGAIGAFGPVRVGLVGRQLFRPRLWRASAPSADLHLERQLRLGVAVDGARLPVDRSAPWLGSLDLDLRAYDTVWGRRRVLAGGAERWWRGTRIGIRAGARVNTTGAHERAAAVGGSVAVVKGVLAEGHVTMGARSERGWSIAARASF